MVKYTYSMTMKGDLKMAFDACFLACMVREINSVASGGRIEKIYQPERDEIILQMRTRDGGKRLLINAGSNNPRISFSTIQRENPMQAPMFCMLLRKHLTGATLSSVEQLEFERVAKLTFDTRDEMGYDCNKYIIAEVMGKYSNLIFADSEMRVISALKTIDFTTSSLRQVLPGMKYELPPPQDKANPISIDRSSFTSLFNAFPKEKNADKFFTASFIGISSALAREMVHRAGYQSDIALASCNFEKLFISFSEVLSTINSTQYSPTVVYDGDRPVEYSFIALNHYGDNFSYKAMDSLSAALDIFYYERDREQTIKQKAHDIFKMLTNAESRLIKKIDAQEKELADCEKGEEHKKIADLITSNVYLLKRGDKEAEVTDYNDWNEETQEFPKIIIALDEKLSPSANAQRYYKLYYKSKTAKIELKKQIEIAKSDLEYVYSVFDALTKAETSSDLSEIREELYRCGFASKMKGYSTSKKQPKPTFAEFVSTNGYRILCGKNNYQNEYITHKLAEKNDYWFHAKNVAGSHVVMLTNGKEPPEQDFTDACEIAAYFSKAKGGKQIEVDYLLCKGVKKVPGAKPGFVVYHQNWSAFVTPNEERISSMRRNK